MHERDKRNKRHYGETLKEPPKPRKSMIMQTPVLVLNASMSPSTFALRAGRLCWC